MVYRICFLNYFTVVILLFAINQTGFSQDPNYKFRHITEEDGLPSVNIQSILRDSHGFLWIGTQSGLCKYDGNSITVFTEVDNDSTSIPGNYIRDLEEKEDSNLWVATTNGLCLYNKNSNSFKRYRHDPENGKSISSSVAYSIAKEKNGNLWVATNDAGLNYFDVKTEEFTRFKHSEAEENSIVENSLTRLCLDSEGRLWIGTIGGTLDLFIDSTNQFKHILLPDQISKSFNRDQIRDIIEDHSGNIWVGTSGSGLFCIQLKNNGMVINQYLSNSNAPIDISNNYISCLELDKAGNLLVGMENGGLNYIDFKQSRTYHYTSDPFNSQSISHNSVWDLYIDKESNLWMSCFPKGIDVNFNEESNFNHFYNIPNNDKSLGFNTVSCFYEDTRGNMWVGTDGGGLDLFDKKTQTFKHYTTKNSSIPSNVILAIFEDSKGVLWIGSWSGGLSIFDYKKETFKTFTAENSNLSCNNIISIREDKTGLLWAGTFWCEGGMNSFDREKNLWQNYTAANSGLSDNTILCMLEDSYGIVWVGTNRGLSYSEKGTNRFNYFRNSELDNTTLSQGTIITLLETRDSVLWIGTANGLNKYNRETKTFRRYNEKDGLPDRYIAGLEEDKDGNIWISTHKGLSKYEPKTNRFQNFKQCFELQKQYYRCSHYKGPDGTIYFGGTNGFNMFDPKEIKTNNYKPPIYFTNFTIFNKPVSIGSENSPLKKHISEATEVLLNYKQNSFTFEFTAINYSSSNETRFAYMLEGFDKDWIFSGTQRFASYTNIDPGKYTLKVKVPYNSGIENEEGISIEVIITPPFWETWWFRFISILFFIILTYGMFVYRLQMVKNRNKQLSKLVDIRTSELKQKNKLLKKQTEELNEVNATKDKFFSIIAHDLKNPFTTILGFSDLLKTNYDTYAENEKKNMINLISESSENIYQLLENLLKWSRSQRGTIEFCPEQTQLKTIQEKVFALLRQNAVQKNIQLISQLEDESLEIYADPQMLETIIRNLVSNAIKFTKTGGQIKVSAKKINGSVVINVSDTGIGIPPQVINRLFNIDSNYSTVGTNNEKGSGLGLILVKEFVSKHNGQIQVESEPGKGSTFSITMPLQE